MGFKISELNQMAAVPASTDEMVINDDSEPLDANKTKRVPYDYVVPTSATPAANKIPIADGTGKISQKWVTDFKNLWVGGWKPCLTNGCAAAAQLEMGTNKNVVDYVAFDKDAIEYAYVNVPMPLDYDGGVITAKFYWLHPAATAFKVSWGLQGIAITDGDALDVAQGTAIYANDEGGTTSDLYISPDTADITIGGTPAAGKMIQFRVSRKADDGTNDTLDVDAYLLGVLIKYGVE